jgi:hypothetical protein
MGPHLKACNTMNLQNFFSLLGEFVSTLFACRVTVTGRLGVSKAGSEFKFHEFSAHP